MRVGLRERRRDPLQPGRKHHRAGDIAAAAEHDVGPAPPEDPQARRGRGGGEAERPREARARLPREALDAEGVEGVAALRNELRLDAIRRPGERHFHAARAQRLRYCERRGDVPHRSPGGDQAPQLSLLVHGHGRC